MNQTEFAIRKTNDSLKMTMEQIIALPWRRKADWRESLPGKLKKIEKGPISIDSKDWLLRCRDLTKIKSLLEKSGLNLQRIHSLIPETIVSASALGIQTQLIVEQEVQKNQKTETAQSSQISPTIYFHHGTLRSGEHLESEGDVLLLGDVNPGAHISADGDVMIWGKLRGTAHAGKSGNQKAKIAALQLRPLQLRIANQVARGPEEKPENGFAEEALIASGNIVIQPAST